MKRSLFRRDAHMARIEGAGPMKEPAGTTRRPPDAVWSRPAGRCARGAGSFIGPARLAAASLFALLAFLPVLSCAQEPPAGDPAAALRAGRYEEAIAGFTRRAPSDPGARRSLVRALAEVGRYPEAEAAAREGGGELANSLGEVLYARGDGPGAEAAFQRAVDAQAADSLTARLNLAVALYQRGEREEALRRFDHFIDVYNRSQSLSPEALTAVGTAVRYLGARDPQLFKDALKAYDEAVQRDPGQVEARLRLGELFLEKYNSPDAQASFKEVLALNPSHPRALLGMAEASYFDGEPESLELAQQSLRVNPRLAPAHLLLARIYLDQEDGGAAEAEVQKALEVNPNSLEALSVLAALRFLRDDRAGYEEARARVLRLNPRYGELYVTVGEMAVRARRYREAVELAQQAVALDSAAWGAYGLLGINQLRLGQADAARTSLERSFAGDPYNVWIKNTLDLLDTFSRYQTRRSARFELVLRADEADLLEPYAAPLAEEAYEKLSARYGYRPETPVRVEFYPSHADFSVRSVGLAGLGALGVAFGNVLALDSPSAREQGQFNWGSTLWHEIAHTVTLGVSNHRVPRWLTEGISVLEERRARPGWGDDVSFDFLRAFQSKKLLPASQLNSGFVRPASPQALGLAYYQASLVAEMIEKEWGPQATVRMLRGYAEGRSTEQLYRSVLQTDAAGFDQRFDRYVRERFAGPLAGLDDFTAQMASGQRLYQAGKTDEAKPYLERARTLFPDYAGGDSPYLLLAAIAEKQGNPRAAVDELLKLTAINENAYAANLKLAELLEGLGDTAGAAAALERAVYIYPYEISLHTRLAGLYQQLGEKPKVVRERRAVVALKPVDAPEALYQLALALFEAGDREGARREVLRALEQAPSFAKAQELLLRLRGASEE